MTENHLCLIGIDSPLNSGKCYSCNDIIPLAQMGKHLIQCTKSDDKENQAFLLKVSAYKSTFWLFLKVNQNCTLDSLDDYLRHVWLECCGHLSHFIIDGVYYEKNTEDVFDEDCKTMRGKVKNIFHHKMRFSHEYDYGSTTTLQLHVQSIINGDSSRKDVELLARNNEIKVDCNSCDDTATSICEMCAYEGKGCLCKGCADKHRCEDCDDEPSFLPVVNSPRMGVCAYEGCSNYV